eukprot:1864022-Prymnesium_polylepis.1
MAHSCAAPPCPRCGECRRCPLNVSTWGDNSVEGNVSKLGRRPPAHVGLHVRHERPSRGAAADEPAAPPRVAALPHRAAGHRTASRWHSLHRLQRGCRAVLLLRHESHPDGLHDAPPSLSLGRVGRDGRGRGTRVVPLLHDGDLPLPARGCAALGRRAGQ